MSPTNRLPQPRKRSCGQIRLQRACPSGPRPTLLRCWCRAISLPWPGYGNPELEVGVPRDARLERLGDLLVIRAPLSRAMYPSDVTLSDDAHHLFVVDRLPLRAIPVIPSVRRHRRKFLGYLRNNRVRLLRHGSGQAVLAKQGIELSAVDEFQRFALSKLSRLGTKSARRNQYALSCT